MYIMYPSVFYLKPDTSDCVYDAYILKGRRIRVFENVLNYGNTFIAYLFLVRINDKIYFLMNKVLILHI